ncbi:MAG: hypothetical protein GWO24_27225, partial [Akkermansiaceae bacterium]|nr:hypothetical protein [Akkermansiaceae bacterium]
PVVFQHPSRGGAQYIDFTYPRRAYAESMLDYRLALATNLLEGTWTTGGYEELPVTGRIDPEFELVTN